MAVGTVAARKDSDEHLSADMLDGLPRPPLQIRLSCMDLRQLQEHLSGGEQPVRSVLRTLVLLQLAGWCQRFADRRR